MASAPDDLLVDPLFQLNLILWLSQPLPIGSELNPIFHRNGFSVYAIAPILSPAVDVRLAAGRAGVAMNDRARPDVVINHRQDRKFALIECKKAWFSPSSSTAGQMRALLAIGGKRGLSDALALSPSQSGEGLVSIFSPDLNWLGWNETLTYLRGELDAIDVDCPPHSALGLEVRGNQLGVIFDSVGATFWLLAVGFAPIIELEADTDPRPLYFIPLDPDVDQTPAERAFCRRVLYERIHSSVLSAIGRAGVVGTLVLRQDDILNDATFGTLSLWQNPSAIRHLRRLLKTFLDSLSESVNQSVPQGMTFHFDDRAWHIELGTEDAHDKIMTAVTRFFLEDEHLGGDPQPGLFENLDD